MFPFPKVGYVNSLEGISSWLSLNFPVSRIKQNTPRRIVSNWLFMNKPNVTYVYQVQRTSFLKMYTPEVSQFAPAKWWLEEDPFLLGWSNSSAASCWTSRKEKSNEMFWDEGTFNQQINAVKTNISSENWWLEDGIFWKWPLFRGHVQFILGRVLIFPDRKKYFQLHPHSHWAEELWLSKSHLSSPWKYVPHLPLICGKLNTFLTHNFV